MEYLLIVVLTLTLSWLIIKVSDNKRMKFLKKHKYRQSDIYEIIKDYIPKKMFGKPKMITQSQKHIQKNMLKVVISNDRAYWILDSMFYTANAINGRVDETTIKPLNFDNMTKQEMVEMLSILDDLRKGNESNDSGSAGDKAV